RYAGSLNLYNMIGSASVQAGDRPRAGKWFRKALEIDPNHYDTLYNMAVTSQELGHKVEAIACFERMLRIKPDSDYIRALKILLQAHICDWDGLRAEEGRIAKLGLEGDAVSPFAVLPLEDRPDRHRIRSERYCAKQFGEHRPMPARLRPQTTPERIKIGYFSAEIRNHPVARLIARVLEHAKKNGVAPVSFGVTDISKREMEARKTFEFAKKMGLYGVTTESIDALDTLEKFAKEYDIKVSFHNHPKPTAMWNPDKTWDAIKDRHANIGFCADVGHWVTSGLDPLEVIKKIAPRVHSFHMKDREAVGKWTHDRPFGTGVIDIAAILDEVRKHGFAGNVAIEYEHNWKTNVPEIAQCVGYLRAYSKVRKET
ncbi:MAG: tetratricopeptide repeat protein, partial [Verrucomicrobiaceae bacterium]